MQVTLEFALIGVWVHRWRMLWTHPYLSLQKCESWEVGVTRGFGVLLPTL